MQGKNKGLFNKFLDGVETVGNKLPHPGTIFLIFAIMVVIISHFAFLSGAEVTFKAINKDHQLVDKTVKAVSLLTPDGIRWMFKSIVKKDVYKRQARYRYRYMSGKKTGSNRICYQKIWRR